MEKTYTVYAHINKITGGIYFGITCMTVESRWRCGKGYSHQYFGKIIKEYGWNNFDHVILKEDVPEKEAEEMEQRLIAKYNTLDENFGYNKSKGRQSSSPQLSKKVFAYTLEGEFVGEFSSQGEAEKATGCRRDMIRKVCRGERYSISNFTFSYKELTKEDVFLRLKQKEEALIKRQEKAVNSTKKSSSQPVYQLDKNTYEIIQEFPSQWEASRQLNINQKCISYAIQKKQCYKGFRWIKKLDYDNMGGYKVES